MNYDDFTGPLQVLERCTQCPRNCKANRLKGRAGYCRSDASFSIASICIHKGEEPAISGPDGICNVFFAGCNLQCLYCQNHQISHTIHRMDQDNNENYQMDLPEVITRITAILDQGINRVGFVSPSHFIPQMKVIINIVESLGYNPIWVYNTNGYDNVESLKSLEGVIGVYLPDFKYSDQDLALKYSGARDYPMHAANALKEMFRQKGTPLMTDVNNVAESGIIVRHLVLPGHVANSIGVLRFLAEEISPRIHVSLMAQYYPTRWVEKHPQLGRGITSEEYQQVVNEMELLGMYNGWIQEFESSDFYRPDFNKPHPFD
ncbi:MAG: radical SAM protein [Bacteroidales bacterium]